MIVSIEHDRYSCVFLYFKQYDIVIDATILIILKPTMTFGRVVQNYERIKSHFTSRAILFSDWLLHLITWLSSTRDSHAVQWIDSLDTEPKFSLTTVRSHRKIY